MTTRIASTNIQSNTILTTNLAQSTIDALQGSTVPTITQIQITTSGYVVKDDTAVSTSGGYIKITGTNFTAGSQVVIGSTPATSVGFVNSTTLNVQVPALAAGTYVVYVTINTGSVAIIVNGLTYSGDPTWVTGSTLSSSQVDAAISIQLSATGDAPVTYALQAGSSLPAGLTLTSSGLLSGTVTGITVETTYNFTIEAIDAQAQESPRTFSITIVANDQFFENVTTLLSANNPTSTFITDASTNNFAVTVFGDTRPNNFGPYTPGYYSGYFDGNGDYLTTTFTSAGSSDFCFECWAFISNVTSNRYIFSQSNAVVGSNADIAFAVLVTSASKAAFYWNFNTTQTSVSSTNNVNLDQWNHIAAVRSGSTFTIYVNGTGTSTTSSGTINVLSSTPRNYIGYFTPEGNSTAMIGYMSNLRLVIGSPVYTSNFTPSTSPLTAIANTTLLTCQSNRFIDNSTNNFTITRFGDTLISGFDPFAPLSAYSTYGSGYFDGTTDYLSLSQQTALSFGTGDFTVEAWVYPTANPSSFWSIIDARGSAIAAPWAAGLRLISGNLRIEFYGGTSIQGSINVPLNSWTHVAFARSGTTLRGFVNGVVDINTTMSTNLNIAAGTQVIGAIIDPTYNTGYLTDVRVVKGTAVYTSAFTPPAAPLTAVANTQLLTLQNNQPNNNNMFLDNSSSNLLATRVGNATQGSFNPYAGVYSVYLPNSGVMNAQSTSGAYVSISNNTGYDLGTGDFTMEGWIYPLSLPSSDNWPASWFQTSSLFGRGTPNLGDGYNLILGATKLIFQNNDSQIANGNHNITVNQWYHVAACRSSGTLRLFVNGTQVATASFSGSVGGGSNWYIGTETGQGAYFNGFISNLRLLKGTALYTTSSFTVPISPLLPITNTTLLTCTDNRLVDDSANAPTVTGVNTPYITRFTPFSPQTQATVTTYSNYFTSSRLSVADATPLNLAGGVYTIEAWIYPYGDYTNWNNIITKRTSGTTSTAWQLALQQSTGYLAFYNGTIYASSSTPIARTWNHVAGVYDGTNINLYLNGSRVLQTAVSNTNVATSVTIGALANGEETFIGLISNLRITKGGQLYTGTTYTVPTAPLTTSVSSGTVSLLTCQSTTLIDNSVNAYAITRTGTVYSVLQNPNGFTNPSVSAYTPAVYGGALYFDGNGDNLTFPDNDAFEIGSGQFTIECWVYPASLKGYQGVLGKTGAADINGWNLYFETNNSINFVSANGGGSWTISLNGGTSVPAGQWNHIAVTKDSSNVYRMFVNGVQVATTTNAFTTNQTSGLFYIGKWPYFPGYANTMDFGGYISDVRIVKGQSLYTDNFVPSSAPLTAVVNSTLLVNGTSAAVYDSSMNTRIETVGTAFATTVQKKYGNSSIYLDGSADYLSLAKNPLIQFNTANFTIECWTYLISRVSNFPCIWSNYSSFTTGSLSLFAGHNSANTSRYQLAVNGAGFPSIQSTTSIVYNTWVHLAVVRNNGVITLYINGVADGTFSFSSALNGVGDNFTIGYSADEASTSLYGYIDDLRITNGIARYTSNFTPPTSPVIQF